MSAVLRDLLSRLQDVLGEHFVGLYLYGSLATGDFDPHRSDIDFLVVTDDDLPPGLISELGALHAQLASTGSHWTKKLEGAYLPMYALRSHNPNDLPRPMIHEGRFRLAREGSDWVLQRHTLREHEAILAGPSLRSAIDPVRPADLRRAVREILAQWWAPMLGDPSRLEAPGYQPYAVLSMCRARHTLEHGTTTTKSEAAAWAMQALDRKWTDLIEHALAWKWGDPIQSLARTLEFVGDTIQRGHTFEGPD